MCHLGVGVVDEGGIILLALDERQGVDPFHQRTVGLIGRPASLLQRADGLQHPLLRALCGEGAHLLVGTLQRGDERGEREGADLCGILPFEVGDEVDEQPRLLVELVGRGDAVVDDVLVEDPGSRRHRFVGEVEEALHRLLVAVVEGVAQPVRLHDVVGQQTLLREFQRVILGSESCLEGGELGGSLGFQLCIFLGIRQDVAYVEIVRTIVHALQCDVFEFHHTQTIFMINTRCRLRVCIGTGTKLQKFS